MHFLKSVIAELIAMPWWLWFGFGFIGGFLMASWVVAWYIRDSENDRRRLSETVGLLRKQLRIATHDNTSMGRMNPFDLDPMECKKNE